MELGRGGPAGRRRRRVERLLASTTQHRVKLLAELRRCDGVEKEVDGVIEIRQDVGDPEGDFQMRRQPTLASRFAVPVVVVVVIGARSVGWNGSLIGFNYS